MFTFASKFFLMNFPFDSANKKSHEVRSELESSGHGILVSADATFSDVSIRAIANGSVLVLCGSVLYK